MARIRVGTHLLDDFDNYYWIAFCFSFTCLVIMMF
jgi:hypothetical protein